MASTYVPPLSPSSRRTVRVAYGQRTWARTSSPLLLLVTAGVFVVSVATLLVAQSGLLARWQPSGAAGAGPATSSVAAPGTSAVGGAPGGAAAAQKLTPADVEKVLSYARAMQPDDVLVQVRPGVFAKRSNVQGVAVNGATVYYDITPHQSYGPLRTGALTEQQVNVVARQAQDSFLVVLYTRK